MTINIVFFLSHSPVPGTTAVITKAYGYDPKWFWMLFLINLVLGSMAPPFGYTLSPLKGAAPNMSLDDIYVGVWPMMIVFLVDMIIMFLFPSIITILPDVFS